MINRVSHAEVAVTDLDRAHEFYVGVLGLHLHERTAEALWLRAPDEFDVWTLKLTRDPEPGVLSFGFRVDSEEALDELAVQHERLGLAHGWRPAGAEPGRGRTLRVRTPGGHIVDFQHEIDETSIEGPRGIQLPMRHSHLRRGVSPSRLDHVNVRVTDMVQALAYWREELGFSISEMQIESDGTPRRVWLRRAPFSHDIAVARGERPGFHHVAFTMRDSQALVNAADVLSDAGLDAREYGPGRHGTTDAFFLYIFDPDGNRVELYAGDYVRDLDRPPVVWTGEEFDARGLLWWGQAPPDSFARSAPVLDRGLLGEDSLSAVGGAAGRA